MKPVALAIGPRMHPGVLRLMHWTNAIAMVIMVMSGWKIYNDEVIFGFLHFPDVLTVGPWAQHGLQWHFFGMWILVLNGMMYLGYGLVTGRFRRLMLPIRPREIIREALAAMRFKLEHDDLTHYNAVQKMLYVGILFVIVVQVITGLAIWKPVQLSFLVAPFVDFQGARLAHFIGMALIVGFVAVHVTLALLVPSTLRAMITGGPRIAPDQPSVRPSVASAPATHV
jgi:thiosulfate reductase cytochrome b subunit